MSSRRLLRVGKNTQHLIKNAQHTDNELEVISNVIGKAKKSRDKEQGSVEIVISAANMRYIPQNPEK